MICFPWEILIGRMIPLATLYQSDLIAFFMLEQIVYLQSGTLSE